jgi:putative acetyltransferase
MDVRIRKFCADDAEATATLFFNTVRQGTQEHYTNLQRRAWAPCVPNVDDWRANLLSKSTHVAEDEKGVAGFMTLEPDGYID